MNAFIQTLRNLGPVRLGVVGAVGIALLALLIYLLTRIGGPEMALLYGNLNPADTAKITQRLDALQIPYRLRGESEVLVPADQVPKARITLAGEGLPSGGSVGYEIFDKAQGLATSSFVQNVNQVRALEGELSRTIASMDGIKTARVHLVLPQRELFTRQTRDPSASIMLRMSGGRLSQPQVLAIQHLAAAAVPGLKPERISIVDERGTLLARGGETSGAVNLQNAEEQRVAHENRLARQIEGLLERTLGVGKARVEVAVQLDYNRVSENLEAFDPNQQVLRSEQTINETAEQSENDSNPSVTVANNLPAGQAGPGGGQTNSSRTARTEETKNYEITRTVRNATREPGAISRITVAALVDGIYATDANGAKVYRERSLEDRKKLEELVWAAFGGIRTRDDVQVINLQFAAPEEELAASQGFLGMERQDIMKLAEILVLGAVGALVLLLVIRPLIARVFEAVPSTASGMGMGMGAAGMLGAAPMAPQLTGPGGMMEPMGAAEEEIEEMIDLNRIEGRVKASSLRKIGEIVEKHPEDVVAILRSWLYQEG